MRHIELVIDQIVLDAADAHREAALRDAVASAVSSGIARAPISPRSAKSAVAERVAQSVTSAVTARGGKP